MAKPGRWLVLLWLVLPLLTAGCGRGSSTPSTPAAWRVLKIGSITQAASESPEDEVHLCQTASEFAAWTQRLGSPVPTDEIDFSRHTVAVLVRRYGAFEPMVKDVEVTGKTARVVLAANPARPNPLPGLPAGTEVRQYLVLQLPKADAVSVAEEQSDP